MKIHKKLVAYCLIAFLAFVLTIFGLGKLLNNKVNYFVMNLAEKISREVGHPVAIESISTKWDWFLLKINIKNLKIIDKVNSVPLFEVSEIISTVNTLDSIRTFSLKLHQLLLRNPQLEISMPIFLEDGVEHSIGRGINPAAIGKILAMQRRINIENGNIYIHGTNGVNLPLKDIKIDFRKTGDSTYNLVARGNIMSDIQPEFIIAIKYSGDINKYDKALINFEVKTSKLQLAELFNIVPQYKQNFIDGDFTTFDIKGLVQNGIIKSITSDFCIGNISLDNDTKIKNGVGHVEYKSISNTISMQLAQLQLSNEKLYTQPVVIDSINSDIIYAQQNDKLLISSKNMQIKCLDIEFYPEIVFSVDENGLDAVTFNTMLQEATPPPKLLALLPDKRLSVSLIDWLHKSIIDGEIENIKILYLDKKLLWSLSFKNTELKFSSSWPSITGIDATLLMNNKKLSINIDKAMILGKKVKKLSTNFKAYKENPYAVIAIDGSIDTDLETGIEYLLQTPLKEGLAAKLESLHPSGSMGLNLSVQFNLAKPETGFAIDGKIELKQAKMLVEKINLPINNLSGFLNFKNNSLSADSLKLFLLGQQATAVISTQSYKNNILHIGIKLPVEIAELEKILPDINFSLIHGMTNVVANIELPLDKNNKNQFLLIKSNLLGISTNYPPPFYKASNTKMPLSLQFNMRESNAYTLNFKVGGLVDGILFITDSKLSGGRVAIGTKLDNCNKINNMQIVGNLKNVDWKEWAPLILKNAQNNLLPIEIDLFITSLRLYGIEFNPINVRYLSAKNELSFDSNIIKGAVTVNKIDDKIDVKLEKLNIPEGALKNTTLVNFTREKNSMQKLPKVQFNCDLLKYKKVTLEKVSLELLPRIYGYEIMNFSITNDSMFLQAQGSWNMDNNKQMTMLSGNAFIQNFGNVLGEFGYVNSITKGKGEINFSVQWDGPPSAFDILKLDGAAHLDIRSGSLTNVNPGFGRIISLLSLETIQRRLQLDFSDVLTRGFAFDKFVADFKIQPGRVTSDNILISSPAAKIELYGNTKLKFQELDLTMYVIPKVGAGLPIAAAIAAGNPAIGAAIWLFDKASGSKISEITKYKYKVTGTWSMPHIGEVLG